MNTLPKEVKLKTPWGMVYLVHGKSDISRFEITHDEYSHLKQVQEMFDAEIISLSKRQGVRLQ